MSEKVKLTIIGIKNDAKKDGDSQTVDVTHDSDATLLSTLQKERLVSESLCGGRGVCGRCRVRFLQTAPLPGSMERRAFTAEELRQGYRLACMARPTNNSVIQLEFIESDKTDIITDVITVSAKDDLDSQPGNGEDVPDLPDGAGSTFIAVDLGTTTIAMQLLDMKSGKVLDTYCAMNPQRSCGADVLSRIQAAEAGHAEALKNCVWKVLQDGAAQFYHTIRQSNSSTPIACMCIAGNTTMGHLLMGLPTDSLGKSPFIPANIELQKCILPTVQDIPLTTQDIQPPVLSSLPVYVLPGISAFVGGDIAAGLYCCHLLDVLPPEIVETAETKARAKESKAKESRAKESEAREAGARDSVKSDFEKSPPAVLFLDLGTNGEMAITDGKRMIATAAAAGPAFEGGAGAAVRGSDMVAVTASLLKQGIIDETGLLAEEYFEQGVTVDSATGLIKSRADEAAGIHLSQQDIRALQMAKAAVRAGVDILHQKMGCPAIAKVYLAGGFGYYLDVDAAIAIGLLPEQWKTVVTAVGNTSLAGAFAMGKDLYTGRIQEKALSEKLHSIECINLAEQEAFAGLYVQYLNFPETKT